MNKFKLLHGTHVDERGNSHIKGSFIYTAHDLAKAFPDRFEFVRTVETAPAEKQAEKEPEKQVEDNLPSTEDETTEEEEEIDEEVVEREDLPGEVTDQFSEAAGKGLAVIKQGRNYIVYEEGDFETPVNRDGSLTRKEDVKTFIAEF